MLVAGGSGIVLLHTYRHTYLLIFKILEVLMIPNNLFNNPRLITKEEKMIPLFSTPDLIAKYFNWKRFERKKSQLFPTVSACWHNSV